MKITKKSVKEYVETLKIDEAINYIQKIQDENNMDLEALLTKYQKKKDAYDKEVLRYNNMCEFEKKFGQEGYRLIAGVDEAGRGPLAGPVVAGAVILKEGEFIAGLNDSKKLSEKKREELFEEITKKAVAYGVGIVDEKCIDQVNILEATKIAMKKAIQSLAVVPEYILIDAVTLEDFPIRHAAIVKGDAKSVSIAAASIIAKVTRDRIITNLANQYPQYGFEKHKGYGTKEHIEAIKKYGACPIHRQTFIKKFV